MKERTMTKDRKDQNEMTKAGAVELEENELDEVAGGSIDVFVKIGDIVGESRDTAKVGDLSLKLDTTGETFKR
jgi:hypothetical protein